MATEAQVGKAKIYGLGAADMTVGAANVATEQTMTGSDFSFDAEINEIRNQEGDTETMIASNPFYSLTINFMPTAATRALAITEAQKFTAATHLVKVVTSGFDVDVFNGKWLLTGLQIRAANTETATFVLNLRAPKATAQRDSLTAGVISG